MQIKVFKAGNMKDTMAAMKAELGEDAVILHSKKYKEGGILGIGSREVVEITAAIEETALPKKTDTPRLVHPTVAPNSLLTRYKSDGTAQGVAEAQQRAESTQLDSLADKVAAQKESDAQTTPNFEDELQTAQEDFVTVNLSEPQPDEQVSPSEDESQADEQVPPSEDESQADEQVPPSEDETQADEQIPPSEDETQADEQVPPSEDESQADEQVPPSEDETQADEQVPPSEDETQADEQIPPSEDETQADEQVPSSEAEPQASPQSPPVAPVFTQEQMAQTQALLMAQFNQMQMMQQAAIAQAQAQAQAQAEEQLRLQQAQAAQQAALVKAQPDTHNEEKIKRLEDEIAQMKALLAEVLGRDTKKGVISLHEALKMQEVSEEILTEMASESNAGDTLVDMHAPAAKATLIKYLNDHIKFSDGIKLNRHGVRIVALLGTTGVGKTTTLAKIAAKFVLEQRTNVALITADTYRISAVEQLKTYSDILELPLEIVYNPAELAASIERHRDKELILIDTAGRSQHNDYQMRELEEFLRINPRIEKHLVISSTTKFTDARQIMNKFSQVEPDRIIFTKTDETGSLGMIINLLRDNVYSLSYITTGQSVPDDIERAGADILANFLLKKVDEQ